MIDFIKGVLVSKEEQSIILESPPFGFRIVVSKETLKSIPNLGESTKLFTYILYKEDSRTIFGFFSKQERSLFEKLLSVSGVGGVSAMTMISSLTVSGIVSAIKNKDSVLIATAKGIGKKTSEKIVIELYDKVITLFSKEEMSTSSNYSNEHEQGNDAINALVNLGINRTVAAKAITEILRKEENSITLEELIKKALAKV